MADMQSRALARIAAEDSLLHFLNGEDSTNNLGVVILDIGIAVVPATKVSAAGGRIKAHLVSFLNFT